MHAALGRRFHRLQREPVVVMAVSGGVDSMAMALLLQEWVARQKGKTSKTHVPKLVAVTVDHGLRPGESDREAQRVREWMGKRGVSHITKTIDWSRILPDYDPATSAKPNQTQCREQRFRLLKEVCQEVDSNVVVLAHHRDDQAETVVQRLRNKSGLLGLAGMTEVVERDDVHGIELVRPMLDCSKSDMRQICVEREQEWCEDPSNQNLGDARIQIRTVLQQPVDNIVLPAIVKDAMAEIGQYCSQVKKFVARTAERFVKTRVLFDTHQGTALVKQGELMGLHPLVFEEVDKIIVHAFNTDRIDISGEKEENRDDDGIRRRRVGSVRARGSREGNGTETSKPTPAIRTSRAMSRGDKPLRAKLFFRLKDAIREESTLTVQQAVVQTSGGYVRFSPSPRVVRRPGAYHTRQPGDTEPKQVENDRIKPGETVCWQGRFAITAHPQNQRDGWVRTVDRRLWDSVVRVTRRDHESRIRTAELANDIIRFAFPIVLGSHMKPHTKVSGGSASGKSSGSGRSSGSKSLRENTAGVHYMSPLESRKEAQQVGEVDGDGWFALPHLGLSWAPHTAQRGGGDRSSKTRAGAGAGAGAGAVSTRLKEDWGKVGQRQDAHVSGEVETAMPAFRFTVKSLLRVPTFVDDTDTNKLYAEFFGHSGVHRKAREQPPSFNLSPHRRATPKAKAKAKATTTTAAATGSPRKGQTKASQATTQKRGRTEGRATAERYARGATSKLPVAPPQRPRNFFGNDRPAWATKHEPSKKPNSQQATAPSPMQSSTSPASSVAASGGASSLSSSLTSSRPRPSSVPSFFGVGQGGERFWKQVRRVGGKGANNTNNQTGSGAGAGSTVRDTVLEMHQAALQHSKVIILPQRVDLSFIYRTRKRISSHEFASATRTTPMSAAEKLVDLPNNNPFRFKK